MGIPTISVTFQALATTAIARSARGVVAIVVQDDTSAFTSKLYGTLAEVSEEHYTAENYAAITRAFADGPHKVIVVRIAGTGAIADATAILDTLIFNWVCAVPSALQAGLVTWVKAKNASASSRKIKAMVAGQSSVDDKHIVNVPNTDVTLVGETTTLDIGLYLPRLAGAAAACPMTESLTGRHLSDLQAVSAIADVDASVDGGNMALYKDDELVRISVGVNTMTTLAGNDTEDMKKITVVEGMDLIREDIVSTFKNSWKGRRKNSADNQALFVSAARAYFRQLEKESVLDPGYENTVDVDLAAIRSAHAAAGTDVSDWTDAMTRKRTFRNQVYLAAEGRILDAMEGMTLVFQMA